MVIVSIVNELLPRSKADRTPLYRNKTRDVPHGANHEEECRKRFGGLSSREELTGMNRNPLEQKHSKKTKQLPTARAKTLEEDQASAKS